jgi:hypothetical protein
MSLEPPVPQEGSTFVPNVDDLLKKKAAETATNLAYGLVVMLAASIILQYVVLAALAWWPSHCEAIPIFEHLFNAWLPVIAGLASSAVTYYLTKK